MMDEIFQEFIDKHDYSFQIEMAVEGTEIDL